MIVGVAALATGTGAGIANAIAAGDGPRGVTISRRSGVVRYHVEGVPGWTRVPRGRSRTAWVAPYNGTVTTTITVNP